MSKRLLIVVNKNNQEAVKASLCLEDYCKTNNISFDTYDGWEVSDSKKLPDKNFDLAVVFGGDGTMLRTSNFIGSNDIPILGINYGNLGFLTNSPDAGIEKLTQAALDGKLKKESRSHLIVNIESDKETKEYIAMNEVSIRRSKSGRIVDFGIDINGEHVCDLRSDGVIASTATGSTAYALAAGGPLVAPTYKGVIIVPLAPHTLNSRPLVTDADDTVEFDFTNDSKEDKLAINVDGEIKKIDGKVLKVTVKADKNETIMLRYSNESFYTRISKVFF